MLKANNNQTEKQRLKNIKRNQIEAYGVKETKKQMQKT